MTHRESIGSFDAKTRFSEILHKIESEEIEYVVTRHGKPIAIISPYLEEENDLKDAISRFIDYRNERNITLNRDKNTALRDITHEDHRY